MDRYVKCNGDASKRIALYQEDINALAQTAAQECASEENALRNMFVRSMGPTQGESFTDRQIKDNLRFNVAIIVKVRQMFREYERKKNSGATTSTPSAERSL